ncbi:MAG TPA: hypothetical protein VLW53_17035 [Candidatus Eisenbacteria bacterium]|nr:hypothetical protein [Candidatus Eisenbacteria bacterium]
MTGLGPRRAPHAGLAVLLLAGAALVVAACGRLPGHLERSAGSAFEVLVASAPDPEGNTTTARFDSTTGRTKTMPAPGNATAPRLTGSGRISYLVTDSIRSQDLRGGGERTEAAGRSLPIAGYAWSSRGDLAYVANPPYAGSTGGAELVIERQDGPTVAIALGPAAGWGGEPPRLQFSPDGTLLLLVDAALGGSPAAALQVRRLDGRLVFGPMSAAPSEAGLPSDAAWAGSRKLYFRDARGVNVADLATGTTRTILPGVRWYRPDTAPDGRTIVFELRDGQGVPRLELLDTTTDTLVAGYERDRATLARFVSPSEIWFHEVGACAGCEEAPPRAEIVSLDTVRLTERPTGLTGFVTDVRWRARAGAGAPASSAPGS